MSMSSEDRNLRGRMAPGDTRQNAVYGRDRVCQEPACATVLSMYNGSGWCWQHEQPHAYVLQAPRKRRRDARVA